MTICLYSSYSHTELLDSIRSVIAERKCLNIYDFLRCLELPYVMSDKQYEQLCTMVDPRNREVLLIRSRGGSKTFDAMIVGVYYAYLGFHVIFWSAQASMMDQPKEYMDTLTSNNFLADCITDKVKTAITFDTGGWIKIKNLTEKQARSPRCDLEIFDEEAQVDEAAYNASSPVLSVSKLKKIIHLSTPVKGSIFEENYIRLKEEGKPCLIMRWDQCAHMNQDAEFIYKELKTKPRWWVRQEYFCSFEAPSGRVFENVIYGAFDLTTLSSNYSRTHVHYGVDWNPVVGHYIVGSRYSDDYNSLFVIMEKNLGNDIKSVCTQILDLLAKDEHSLCELEDGGVNTGYCDSFFQYAYELSSTNPKLKTVLNRISRRPWDSAGLNKHKSITNLLPVIIKCDNRLTPNVSYWLSSASWDKNSSQPKLEKDSDQHPLDALLHSTWIADYGVNHG